MIHELTHGLSSRLTGGAQTKMCMTETESRGLGEGYSDMVALIFTTKPEDTRNTIKVIAEYVEGDQRGNRSHATHVDQPMMQCWQLMTHHYGGIHEHLIRKDLPKRGLGSISQLDPTMNDAKRCFVNLTVTPDS
ncbi:hypothetical protein BASA60_002335 [Batrachochytrium salamandrivorans]|nr:hypothetical protein BASA60_002335 [Batrachochytrium salamandrivorans]